MPLPIDQLPPTIRSLPERLTRLERQFTERAAARRLEHSTLTGASLAMVGDVTINGALDVTGALTSAGSPLGSPLDWINVKTQFGARGDGASDDINALRAAVDAAAAGGGRTVYLPPGIYRTSDTLPGDTSVTILGSHATPWPGRFPTSVCAIKPLPGFLGESVISLQGADITGSPANEGNFSLIDVDLDGSALAAGSVSGIHAQGEVMGVTLRRVTIRNMTHNGIHTNVGLGVRAPHDWFMSDVVVFQCSAFGYSMSMTDGYMQNCFASTNGSDGFLMGPFGSMVMQGCQALFNGGHGLNIGGGTQVGNLTIANFLTDRNSHDGIHVGPSTGTGSSPIIFSGITCNRDGKNGNLGGGGYAGFSAVGCANPIIVTGIVVNTGVDDSGAGANSPDKAAHFSGNAFVSVASGYLHGDIQGWHDDGTNTVIHRGLNIGEATGPKSTPTFAYSGGVRTTDGVINASNVNLFTASATAPAVDIITNNAAGTGVRITNQIAGGSGINIINAAAGDAALSARQAADAFARVRLGSDGALSIGPGTVTRDATLSRTAAGQLTAATADVRVGTAGRTVMVAEGTNAKMGTATLAAGTATVTTTAITATSRVHVTSQVDGGTPGFLRVSARTAGTSFTITSGSATDTSTVAWLIVEPA